MSILRSTRRLQAIIVLVIATALGPTIITCSPLKSIKQLLQQRGIGLDRDSLLTALRGSDETSRGLAASELSFEHVTEAAPYVASAFQKATSSVGRLNLAAALMRLDSAAGAVLMQNICENSSENSAVRLDAVQRLQRSGLHSCDSLVSRIARLSEDPSVKIQAISLLRGSSQEEERFLLEAELLNDENAGVRLAAVSDLASSTREDAPKTLRLRMERESDEDVRSELRKALARQTQTR